MSGTINDAGSLRSLISRGYVNKFTISGGGLSPQGNLNRST